MPSATPAPAVLHREFLEVRAGILELAAFFDRLDRGAGSVTLDPRMPLLLRAIEVLQQSRSDRAEQIQLIFSRPYEDDWREKMHV